FPVLNVIFEGIYGVNPYKSPTDMGVNMAGYCITDDEACREASCREIIRRYYAAMAELRRGNGTHEEVYKIELLMKKAGISPADRKVATAALEMAKATGSPATAIELPDGRIVTGKTSSLLGASSAMLLDALKALCGIPDKRLLLARSIIEPVQELKVRFLGNKNPLLHTDEVLVTLSICAATDPVARQALEQLPNLAGCDVHSSVILSPADSNTFRKLGVNLTCEPQYESNQLFHRG
ncbi:MAG: DUF1846 family protein, partial [Oscillospiraceae bacterium]|nr:DUF1846 family protein [Oscillospiraceae bacterium]